MLVEKKNKYLCTDGGNVQAKTPEEMMWVK